ncbi:MAG: hypothetical protein KIS78_04815 [Labilithrix sp.]|nr:hypothetical protein [Labilithrix sp.]
MAAKKKKRGWASRAWRAVTGATAPKIEPDALAVGSEWRAIMVASARTASAHAKAHAARARAFMTWGFAIAGLGLLVFLCMIAMYEWSRAYWHASEAILGDLKARRLSLSGEVAVSLQYRRDEMERKVALVDTIEAAKKATADEQHLKAFEASAEKVVKAIDDSERYRSTHLQDSLRDFEARVAMVDRVSDAQNSFQWSRDLFPLARSVAVLFFIEVLAGVMLALSRRQEALALLWMKQRAACERVLALPGILGDLKAAGVAATDAIVNALTASPTGDDAGSASEVNPVVDAIRTAIATAASKGKPGLIDS